MSIESSSPTEELSSQFQEVVVTKHGRPKKFQSPEEKKLHAQQLNKELREKQKPYLDLRKYYDNHEKFFGLINICYPEKRVLNCVENVELFNQFVLELKYH